MPMRDPLPRDALTRVDPNRVKLLHLMALALHERGAAMSYDEIRERLCAIGVDRPVGALQKAWHGRSLLRKSRDGKFHLVGDDAYGDWSYVRAVTHQELERAPSGGPTPRPPLALVSPQATDARKPLSIAAIRIVDAIGAPERPA